MDDMKISRSAMIAITLLRVVVGWHFLYEGISKLTSPSWSAAGYMKVSRGPFADFFHHVASQPQLLDKANLITMYGLAIVGALLILGLFTRLAAIGGIAFVLLFYLCNPPFVGYFYSIPTECRHLIVNKNLVEVALAVILLTRSGLYAGLIDPARPGVLRVPPGESRCGIELYRAVRRRFEPPSRFSKSAKRGSLEAVLHLATYEEGPISVSCSARAIHSNARSRSPSPL